MTDSDLDLVTIFYRFGVALVLGTLVGLEREYTQESDQSDEEAFAGLRTFTFISLLGCGAAFVAELGLEWFFPAAFIALAALVSASYVITATAGEIVCSPSARCHSPAVGNRYPSADHFTYNFGSGRRLAKAGLHCASCSGLLY